MMFGIIEEVGGQEKEVKQEHHSADIFGVLTL
jgi:hypothetical protein